MNPYIKLEIARGLIAEKIADAMMVQKLPADDEYVKQLFELRNLVYMGDMSAIDFVLQLNEEEKRLSEDIKLDKDEQEQSQKGE